MERIQAGHACVRYVRNIPCNQRKAINVCGRCQQAIDGWQGSNPVESTPFFGDRHRDRQNPPTERLPDLREPSIKSDCLLRVARPGSFDSLSNLTDDENAEIQILVSDSGKPRCYMRVHPALLSNLGYDVCVDQETQSSIARPVSRERLIRTPSRGAAASSALSPSLPGLISAVSSFLIRSAASPSSRSSFASRRISDASDSDTSTSTRLSPCSLSRRR